MKFNRFFYLALVLIMQTSFLRAYHVSIREKENLPVYDLMVYGATPSGIIAAITAAREGEKVIIIEPG